MVNGLSARTLPFFTNDLRCGVRESLPILLLLWVFAAPVLLEARVHLGWEEFQNSRHFQRTKARDKILVTSHGRSLLNGHGAAFLPFSQRKDCSTVPCELTSPGRNYFPNTSRSRDWATVAQLTCSNDTIVTRRRRQRVRRSSPLSSRRISLLSAVFVHVDIFRCALFH